MTTPWRSKQPNSHGYWWVDNIFGPRPILIRDRGYWDGIETGEFIGYFGGIGFMLDISAGPHANTEERNGWLDPRDWRIPYRMWSGPLTPPPSLQDLEQAA